jgi:hypothetical protein
MKRLLVIVVPVLLLACLCPVPAVLMTPTPGATVTEPASTPLAVLLPTLTQAAPAAKTFSSPSSVRRVRLYPQNGDLKTQVQSEVLRAAALRLTPFVSFDALW